MDKIYLIQQFYIPNDKIRYLETKTCLKINNNNKFINKIILLNEKIYTNKELGFDSSQNKIQQINIKKRLKFKNIFEYIKNNNNINGYIIISNSDIYFNNSLINIYKLQFKSKRICLAQLRTEIKSNVIKVMQNASYSQDTWIYHSKHKINNINDFDFNFGVLGCDNNMCYYLNKDKFKLYNFPNLIKCIHLHKSKNRNGELYHNKIKNSKILHVKPIYF